MKKIIFLFVFFIANFITAQSTYDKWPAIKEFHEVISQTFHPSEEGNLESIKSRSSELADKAEAIRESEIPTVYQTKEILLATEKLQIRTKALHKKIVLKASDEEITKLLSEVHDIFHEIVGLCNNEKH